MIKERQPTILILDIRMESPEAGFAVLDLLRLDPTTTHIPVIICTAAIQLIRENEQHLRAKNCEILIKPFDLDDLLDIVKRVCERL